MEMSGYPLYMVYTYNKKREEKKGGMIKMKNFTFCKLLHRIFTRNFFFKLTKKK